MQLTITVYGTSGTFNHSVENVQKLLIGRIDPETGLSPDIDLDAYNARDKGVSRQHAAIIRQQESLYVLDLKSSNGTYLNETQLVPFQPSILNDQDVIRVGKVVLQINLTSTTPDDPADP